MEAVSVLLFPWWGYCKPLLGRPWRSTGGRQTWKKKKRGKKGKGDSLEDNFISRLLPRESGRGRKEREGRFLHFVRQPYETEKYEKGNYVNGNRKQTFVLIFGNLRPQNIFKTILKCGDREVLLLSPSPFPSFTGGVGVGAKIGTVVEREEEGNGGERSILLRLSAQEGRNWKFPDRRA